jgi:hypothetical protein
MASDRDPDKWLERMLKHQTPSDPVAGACLDVETLAAWADGRLKSTELAAAELHASGCSRCQSLVAAMARSAPMPQTVRRAWTAGRLVRWVVPVAAAATAVAIWVAVPDRPVSELQRIAPQEEIARGPAAPPAALPPASDAKSFAAEPQSAKELRSVERADRTTASRERGTGRRETGARAPGTREPGTPEPGIRNREPGTGTVLRDADRSMAAENAAAAAAAAPADARAASATAKRVEPKPEALSERVTVGQPRGFDTAIALIESESPSNPRIRWRVTSGTLVERSSDGGESWTKTSSPPAPIKAIEVQDAARATVTTTDGRRFSTSDAGATWTAVQEKSAAPF